jgi:hypothetical protein
MTYESLYSALYEWNLRRWDGDSYMASFMTAAGLAGALTMNLALMLGLFVAKYGALTIPPFDRTWVFFSIPVAFLLLNYTAFLRDDRYVEIVRRFRAKPNIERRRVAIGAWTYVLASYGLPVLFAFAMAALAGNLHILPNAVG